MQYSACVGAAYTALIDEMKIDRSLPAAERGLADHSSRDPLRQEERPARVGVVHPVVALERRVEEIAAIARLHAGVVHDAVEGAERIPHRVDERPVLVDRGDVAAHESGTPAALYDARERFVDGLVLHDVVDHDVEAASRELPARCRGRCRAARR